MRKILLALSCTIFVSTLCAQDEPSSVPRPPLPPTIARTEVQREVIEKLATPEEDKMYFGDVEGRFERERLVIIKQTKLSVEESNDDLLVIYLLTVYSSDGECYGLCKVVEPLPDGEPRFFWRVIPIDPALVPATLTGGFFFYTKTPSRGFFVNSTSPTRNTGGIENIQQ